MSIYEMAMVQVKDDLEGIKTSLNDFYNYEVINNVNCRIKTPDSIIKKMEKKQYNLNYKNLIENFANVKTEIQIRTMAMDFWSSTEHKIKYKAKCKLSKNDSKKMVRYAKIVNKLDDRMMEIHSLRKKFLSKYSKLMACQNLF